MKNYQMELCGVQRTLPFIPISDDMAFASFVVLGDTELVSACAPVLAEKIGPVDAVVTAEAKGIALSHVSGAAEANIRSAHLDYDDGRAEYEIEIIYGTTEYDFEIDAVSGAVISQDMDSIYD